MARFGAGHRAGGKAKPRPRVPGTVPSCGVRESGHSPVSRSKPCRPAGAGLGMEAYRVTQDSAFGSILGYSIPPRKRGLTTNLGLETLSILRGI